MRSRRSLTGRDSVGWPKTTTWSIWSAIGAWSISSRYATSALSPVRAPELGSANSGSPARSAKARAGGPASSPATTTACGRIVSSGPPVPSAARGPAPPPGGTSGPPRSSVARTAGAHSPASTRGSSSSRLRCDGPGAPASWARIASGSSPYAMRGNMPTWSVVWLAPVLRSRAGRSAVTASSRTPACRASSRAGYRLADAVPDVVTTGTQERDALASPRARKLAVRSSTRTCSRSAPARSAAASAIANGPEREPGAMTASRTPASSRSSTSERQMDVALIAAPPLRRAKDTAAPR